MSRVPGNASNASSTRSTWRRGCARLLPSATYAGTQRGFGALGDLLTVLLFKTQNRWVYYAGGND